MKRKYKRMTFVGIALGLLAISAALMLNAFKDNIVFFYSPTDLAVKQPGPEQRLRVGGLVEEGSVERGGSAIVNFIITDNTKTVKVYFKGILPDLFREGQGVVVQGRYQNGVFNADEVLAKHDETYMPPEVADALKKSGEWKRKEEQ